MKEIVRMLVVGLALWGGIPLRGAQQAQERPDASERGKLPEWMSDYLPKTPEDRAKAALFDAAGSSMLRLGTGSIVFVCGVQMTGEPPSYPEFTTRLACGYDAVVLGTPTPLAVRINNRGTWLYTEHAVKVRRWVSPAAETTAEIEVLTSGGVISIGGQTTTIGTGERQLQASTENLFFLKRVPGSRAFSLANVGVVDTKGWAGQLQMPFLPYELRHGDVPFDRFVDDLAIAAARCEPRAKRP